MKRDILKKLLGPAIALAVVAVVFVLLSRDTGGRERQVNGLAVTLPEGYACTFTDTRYSTWQYTGTDKKPGRIILDTGIKNENAGLYSTVEQVMAHADWMADRQLVVNPHGVRLVRGHAFYDGVREIRCYVESPGAVFLLCMKLDPRWYDDGDCEAAMDAAADSIQLPR